MGEYREFAEEKMGPVTPEMQEKAEALHALARSERSGFLQTLREVAGQVGFQFHEGNPDKADPYESAVKTVDGILKKLRQGRDVTDALRWTLVLPVNAAGDVPRYAQPFIQEMERRGYAIKEMDDSLTKETKKGPYQDVAFKLVKGDQTLVRELQLLQPHMLAAKQEMHDYYAVQQKVQLALKNPNLPEDGRELLSVVMEFVMAEQKMAYTEAYRRDNPDAGLWSMPSNALNDAPMTASRIADSSSQTPTSSRSALSSSKVRPVIESAPTSSSDIAKTSSREKTSRAMGDTSTGIVPQEGEAHCEASTLQPGPGHRLFTALTQSQSPLRSRFLASVGGFRSGRWSKAACGA